MTSGWGACWALSDRNVECCLKLFVLCVASQLMRVYEWRSSRKRKVFHVTISKCGLTAKGFQCYLLIKMILKKKDLPWKDPSLE